MAMTKNSAGTSDAKRRYKGLLALCVITTVLLSSLIAAGIQPPATTILTRPSVSHEAAGAEPLDPTAYINGYHLYDVDNWFIPSTGDNITLNLPAGWNVTRLGLNFFNGTLQQTSFLNTTTATATLNTQIGDQYQGEISTQKANLKVPPNSTIYQAMFNITSVSMADNNYWLVANGASNSSYPVIDGNIGVAQRFFIHVYAQSLSFQVNLFKLDGTVLNLTAEVRYSTSDNNVGELIESVSISPTAVSLGSAWVTIAVPYVNLTAGYYVLALHTDGWLSSGGGYVAQTTLNKQPSNPTTGWVSSDRGVNWQNLVNIAGSPYYFDGFTLRVHVKSLATTLSNINLRINGIPVADNFIWNQSVWNTAPPYGFLLTSSYPIAQLNFTYKIWYYVYGYNNLFINGDHITVNNKTTTASASTGSFAFMRVTLEQSDLLVRGVVNITTSTVKLNLKLFNGTNSAKSGSVNVTAWAQLTRKVDGLTFAGPYSLVLKFIYNHPVGSDNNVTLSEDSVDISPIQNKIDNVLVNNVTANTSRWSYNLVGGVLSVFRGAFSSLTQFTLLSGEKLNCTVVIFNNVTAATSATVTGYLPDTTPTARLNVQNSSPLIDLDGLTQVNVTVTNPAGSLINNTELTLVAGQYNFSLTVSGEGVYGIKLISNDSTGRLATRWIGSATVNDITLAPPTVTLSPASNLTSQQMVLILANASYTGHPELSFNGNLTITIYVGDTGNFTQLTATWNTTIKLYQATYQAPNVDRTTQLNIQIRACDAKHRISTTLTSTYVTAPPTPPPPPMEPSSAIIMLLAIVAVLLLVPALAYLIEKHRKR